MVHDVHDLLVGFLGDPAVAADATVDVVLRAAARVVDGDDRRLDLHGLRRAAVRHAVALAEAGMVPVDPAAMRDVVVFDLVERRALDRPTTARTANVPRRAVTSHRDRARRRLVGVAGSGSAAAEQLVRDRADGPWRVAPPHVIAAVAPTLATVPTRRSPVRRVARVAGVVAGTLAALAVVVAGGVQLVDELTTDTVVGRPVAFTPTPSTAVEGDLQERTRVAADDDGELLLPGEDETAAGG